MRAPIIGITTETNDQNEYVLPVEYAEAIRKAGGIPLLLPPGEPNIGAVLELLDGLILSGGGDIDPLHYGSGGHPAVYMIDAARDEMELALAQHAAGGDLPTLGVCRGAQLINVALGGTLVEHLPDEIDNTIAHRMEPRGYVPHPVTIAPSSQLAAVIGEQVVVGASWHHQAIRTPAPGLEVVAQAADGTIEAVELPGHPWLLAVQWHPEITAGKDPVQQRLFDALVAAARERMRAG
ncbi:MAG: gamma-glutamyl-gamma-aminobutyrate hydrolase family protein [Caldilineaceae bacterium]